MERYYTPCWRPGCGSAKSHLLEKVPECVHVEVEVDYPDLVYPQKLPQLLAGVKSEWVYKNGSIRIHLEPASTSQSKLSRTPIETSSLPPFVSSRSWSRARRWLSLRLLIPSNISKTGSIQSSASQSQTVTYEQERQSWGPQPAKKKLRDKRSMHLLEGDEENYI